MRNFLPCSLLRRHARSRMCWTSQQGSAEGENEQSRRPQWLQACRPTDCPNRHRWQPAHGRNPGLESRRSAGVFSVRSSVHRIRPADLAVQVEAFHWTDCGRSEEHTSELQSLMRISYAVFCLKKKINNENKNSLQH